jgi:hypothetical protein
MNTYLAAAAAAVALRPSESMPNNKPQIVPRKQGPGTTRTAAEAAALTVIIKYVARGL